MIARTEVRNGPEEMILYHIQSHYTYSIESGINVLPGKFGKKNKRSPIYTFYYLNRLYEVRNKAVAPGKEAKD